jgi:hypothetical protein
MLSFYPESLLNKAEIDETEFRRIVVRRTLALCMKQTVNFNNYGNQDLNYPTR